MYNKYKAGNQGLAAYLLMQGKTFLDVELKVEDTKARTYFIFDMTIEEGREIATDFFNGSFHVEANEYYQKIMEIKSKAFEARKSHDANS